MTIETVKEKTAEWLMKQGAVTVILCALMFYQVPRYIESINETIKALATEHKESVSKLVDGHLKERRRQDEWLRTILSDRGVPAPGQWEVPSDN